MMRYSVFPNIRGRDPVMVEESWPEFVATMRDFSTQPRPATVEEKTDHTPMISPAIYAADATRKNENVEGFGGWFALDIDRGDYAFGDVVALFDHLACDYAIWTTTKSKLGAERMRATFRLDRDVEAEECRSLWAGCHAYFYEIGDGQTKDPSRILAVPALWEGSDARFGAACDRGALSVATLLSHAPAPPEIVPMEVTKPQLAAIRRALAGKGKAVTGSLYDCKAVHPRYVEEYLALPRGDHHRGLYQFMARVAERALFLGLDIQPHHLSDYARQLDAICMVKTSNARWSRINGEAATALRWAKVTYNQKEFQTC